MASDTLPSLSHASESGGLVRDDSSQPPGPWSGTNQRRVGARIEAQPDGKNHSDEPKLFGRSGDLTKVAQCRLSSTGDNVLVPHMTTADDVPAVSGGEESQWKVMQSSGQSAHFLASSS
jgi:hypothetical protein